MLASLRQPRDRQPQFRAALDKASALGAVLDYAWLGSDASGVDVSGRLRPALAAGTKVVARPNGRALENTGSTVTSATFPAVSVFPYVQIALGYVNNIAGVALSQLGKSGGGYSSSIELYSSTQVTLGIRFNYGTYRNITITTGVGTSSGMLLCALAQVFSATDYRLYCNGQQANGSASPGTFGSLDLVTVPGSSLYGGLLMTGFGFGRTLPDDLARLISAQPKRIWEAFQAPSRRIWVPGSASPDLAGSASGAASASGSLTTQIPIAGAATVVATAAGTLSTGIPLAGIAASVAVANGVLTASIRLSGAALGQVLASASLSGGAAALAGAAAANASGAATLSTGISLGGAAAAGASGSAPLTTQIRLAGAAVMQALAAAGLTTVPSGLAGGATASASGTGALSTAVRLVGQASAIAIGAGGLTTGIALTGSAAAACHATGDLTIASSFSAAALAQVAASGTLSTQIRLNAAAVAQAIATASLASGGSAILLADADYLARQPRRQHVARRDRRAWEARLTRRAYDVRRVA